MERVYRTASPQRNLRFRIQAVGGRASTGDNDEMATEFLTFECDSEREQVEIYANKAGLECLIKTLCSLRDNDSNDHEHLMSPEWGGAELSVESQNPQFSLIHHVKIYKR